MSRWKALSWIERLSASNSGTKWLSNATRLLGRIASIASTSVNEFITCFFTNPESTNLRIFMFHFLKGCKVTFCVMINSYIGIFYLNRKLLPCRKTKQRKFCGKFSSIRRFRNRENMWWVWPVARNLAGNSWLTSRSWGMTFSSVPGKKQIGL